MPVHGLGAADWYAIRGFAEHLLDCHRLGLVVQRSGGGVGVDVVYLGGAEPRLGQRLAHGAYGLRAVGARCGHVVRVRGGGVA